MNQSTKKKFLRGSLIFLSIVIILRSFQVIRNAKILGTNVAGVLKNDLVTATINAAINQNGIDSIRSATVISSAELIYTAFYKTSLWGFGEDEETAISVFNSLQNNGEAKASAIIYKANFSKSLYADFVKYCHGSNWRSLNTSYLNAIKSL